jgi:hypothetical protein
MNARMRELALTTHTLAVRLMVWSTTMIEVRVSRKFANTGEVLRKGIVEFAFLQAPLHDSCC